MKQGNFRLIEGQATGPYQFRTDFYGLIDMPAEFQKTIDLTLNNEKDTFAFLDDIFIISRGTKEDHMNKLKKNFRQTGRQEYGNITRQKKIGCKQVE